MSPIELSERLQSEVPPCLLDVRNEDEHALVHLPGALLVPLPEIQDRVGELEGWKDKEVVVYCHHGVRSLHAIHFLRQAGFEQLHNLDGGIDRWSTDVDSSLTRY